MITTISLEWDAPSPDAPLMELADICDQLRISHDEHDNLIMNHHLAAGVEFVEGVTGRSLISKVHRWIIDKFPGSVSVIALPRGKTQSVTSIVYSLSGVATTLRGPTSGSPIGTDYQEDLRGDYGGILMPTRSGSWPTADIDVPAPVLITYTAGWAVADVPAELKLGVVAYIGQSLMLPEWQNVDVQSLVSAWGVHRWR